MRLWVKERPICVTRDIAAEVPGQQDVPKLMREGEALSNSRASVLNRMSGREL